ncbi:hypothetical protein Cgig2_032675 [Carnegiea gigantea]|uniref:STAS domain-containing protein n=1 Tax=Carnegiea gigantea TaxID=171969 RepID=A0A9Q1GJ05_9CARY|nr:hypothetical protein Cgig2_032675 [Carnegiea gigantea]
MGLQTKQNLLKEFEDGFKETFFSDNPLHSFKGQSTSRRFLILLEAIFPIIGWLRSYSFSKFRGDLLSGVIASMQDIAYAKLANLAPQYGLCLPVISHDHVHGLLYLGSFLALLSIGTFNNIDTSGTHALGKLYMSLKKKNVQLVIGGPGELVVNKLHASGLFNLIGSDNVFPSLADAVLACPQEP